MPQIYTARPEPPRRRLSSESSSTISNTEPQVTDVDDTIVLSDLVRTGEASRLRRRGAMRLDHNSGQSVQSRNIVVVDRPNWESDHEYDLDFAEGHLGSSGRSSSMRYTRRRQRSRRYEPYDTAEEQADEAMYTLVCGVESYGPCELEPFAPSILPLYPPPQDAREEMTSKRSTGCGSVVHMRASPRPRVGLWSACGPASDVVVPLDADYFDGKEVGRRVRASCGCLKEGIGCAVWYVMSVLSSRCHYSTHAIVLVATLWERALCLASLPQMGSTAQNIQTSHSRHAFEAQKVRNIGKLQLLRPPITPYTPSFLMLSPQHPGIASR